MYFGQIYGFGEMVLAKLEIWRNGFGEIGFGEMYFGQINGFGEMILAN